ncbi:unnamed protein product [Closterium sp. NIES-64]|nr:unnamed protein product [Closterium sp. NIES-64]
MPHHYSIEMWERTHKGTVKGPVRGSNWSDIPRRIVEEEVQREVYREVAAGAGGGRQYACALREAIMTKKPVLTKKYWIMRIGGASDPVYDEYITALGDDMKGLADELKALGLATNSVQVHTAVAIPRTRGGELVAKGTFMKASPRERWYSDVALLNDKGGDWYAKCLCIFRAVDRDGDWKGYAYVSRDRNTIILTIHKAHRITGKVAPPVTEHGFSVQHLKNTRVVNIRGSVPETGLPHLQGVGDALKAYYRVMLIRRAIGSKRFQFDYSASIADVDYNDILEWLGEAWTPVRTATMQRSWWRAGCVPASWPPLMAYLGDTCATGMFEPIISRADELGNPPAAVPAEVGASNQEVISRLCRTPVKRACVGGRAENGTAEEVLQSDEMLESDDDQ